MIVPQVPQCRIYVRVKVEDEKSVSNIINLVDIIEVGNYNIMVMSLPPTAHPNSLKTFIMPQSVSIKDKL